MIPVFIGYQVKKALTEAAEEVTLSDIKKIQMAEEIMGRLKISMERGLEPYQIKNITQDDKVLSIVIDPSLVKNMVIVHEDKRCFLLVKRKQEEEQIEFIIDTFKKINVVFC